MKLRLLSILLLAAVAARTIARQPDTRPVNAAGAPIGQARKLTPDEARVFKLAQTYREAQEPLLDFHQLTPGITRDATTSVWTVRLWAVPKGEEGSRRWGCATVNFKVFVHPDGTVSEPKWRVLYCW